MFRKKAFIISVYGIIFVHMHNNKKTDFFLYFSFTHICMVVVYISYVWNLIFLLRFIPLFFRFLILVRYEIKSMHLVVHYTVCCQEYIMRFTEHFTHRIDETNRTSQNEKENNWNFFQHTIRLQYFFILENFYYFLRHFFCLYWYSFN